MNKRMISTLRFKRPLTILLLITASVSLHAQGDFWSKTQGPYGVNLWAALVTSNGTYFGGSGDGKIFRKLPGKDRWDVVLTTTGTILAIVEYNSTIYASDADGMLVTSTDNGNSWQSIATGLPASQVRSIALNDNGVLFIGTGDGVYKRVPGASPGTFSWEHKPFPTQYGMFTFSICNNKHGVMYAGTGRGIYRSDNQGDTWTLSAMDETANSIMSLATNDKGDVYAGTAEQGLFINYADDGKDNTWVSIGGDVFVGKQIRRVTVLGGSKVFVSIAGSGTYYSNTDTAWKLLIAQDSRAGIFHDQVTGQLVMATLNGLWTSPYGDTFSFSQVGLPMDISFLSSYQSKLIVMADGDTRLFESADRGNTWTHIFSNSEGSVTCYAEKDNGDKFVGCTGGFNNSPWVSAYIYLDGIGKRDWFSLGFPASVTSINTVYITSKDSIYAGTNAGLFRIHTKTYEVNLVSKIASGVSIRSLAELPGGYLYAATNDGLYISADNGLHWTVQKLDNLTINDLALRGEHQAYVATSAGLYFINGLAAEPVAVGGFNKGLFSDVAWDDRGHLYAVGDNSVYYAVDQNSSWQMQTSGVENYRYARLHVMGNDVYLSTDVGVHKHTFALPAQVTLSGLGTFNYNGQPRAATATTVPAGLTVNILYNSKPDVPVEGGSYQVIASIDDPLYVGKTEGRITIEKISAEITLTGLGNRTYNGSPIFVTAQTVPAGLPLIITYNEKTAQPTEIGEYYVRAVIDHASYKGEAAGDMIIQDAVMGTEEPGEHAWLIYPVPAHSTVVIESNHEAMKSITLSDVMGRPLQQVSFNNPVTSHHLDVSHFPAGTLLMKIVTDKNEQIIRKIQVVR